MSRKHAVLLSAAALALALATGCASFDDWSGAPLTADERVAAQAMDAIRGDSSLGAGSVSVDVFRGVATVSGVVESHADRVRVLRIVDDLDGVNEVRDELKVR